MVALLASRRSALPALAALVALNAAAVSSLYWAQSVAPLAGAELGASAWIGLAPSAALAGYAIGVAFLAAFARDLTSANGVGLHALLLGAGLSVTATAPTAPVIVAGSLLVGIGCSLTQRVLGCATSAVALPLRGPVIGGVIASGLTGIVIARAAVPAAAHALGWRNVFMLDAMLVCAVGLLAAITTLRLDRRGWETDDAPLPSAYSLWRREAVVRRAALQQACVFAAFNGGWALFPVLLAQHQLSGALPTGLVASLGAAAALGAGWRCRTGDPARVAQAGLALVVAALAAGFLAAEDWRFGLLAMLCLDTGTQVALVSNQARAQARATSPAMRGRIAAIVTTVGFGAGAIGAAIGNVLWR